MKGYWKDAKATKETLKDGWLHTGDIASIHDDGFIEITGRVKEIIVNSGGDNISPSRVESLLCFQPEIEAAVVIGDKRPWLCGIIATTEQFNEEYVSITEKQHVINLFKLLIKEDINVDNISFKRNELNNIVATYLKENTVKNTGKVIDGVLKVLEKQK